MGKAIHKKLCLGCKGEIEVVEDYAPGPTNRVVYESSMFTGWHPKCKELFEANNAFDFASQFYYNLPED